MNIPNQVQRLPQVYIRSDHNTSILGQGPKSSIIAVGVLEDQNITSLFLIEIWNELIDRQKKLGMFHKFHRHKQWKSVLKLLDVFLGLPSQLSW